MSQTKEQKPRDWLREQEEELGEEYLEKYRAATTDKAKRAEYREHKMRLENLKEEYCRLYPFNPKHIT